MDKYTRLNLRLAQLIEPERRYGVVDEEVAYLNDGGNPAVMPDWARDSGKSFELQLEHGIVIRRHDSGITASTHHGSFDANYADHDDDALTAGRFVVAQAAIAKLEAELGLNTANTVRYSAITGQPLPPAADEEISGAALAEHLGSFWSDEVQAKITDALIPAMSEMGLSQDQFATMTKYFVNDGLDEKGKARLAEALVGAMRDVTFSRSQHATMIEHLRRVDLAPQEPPQTKSPGMGC